MAKAGADSVASGRAIGEKLSLEYPLAEVSLSKYGEEIEAVISGYPEEEWDNIESDILSVFTEENRIIRVLKSVPISSISPFPLS